MLIPIASSDHVLTCPPSETLSLAGHSCTNRYCFKDNSLQPCDAFHFTQPFVDFLPAVLLVQGQRCGRCFPAAVSTHSYTLPTLDTHLPASSAKKSRLLVDILHALPQTRPTSNRYLPAIPAKQSNISPTRNPNSRCRTNPLKLHLSILSKQCSTASSCKSGRWDLQSNCTARDIDISLRSTACYSTPVTNTKQPCTAASDAS